MTCPQVELKIFLQRAESELKNETVYFQLLIPYSDDGVYQSVAHTVWFHNLAHFPCLGTLFVHIKRETTPF